MHAFVLTPPSGRRALHSFRSSALGRPVTLNVSPFSNRPSFIVAPSPTTPSHLHTIRCQETAGESEASEEATPPAPASEELAAAAAAPPVVEETPEATTAEPESAAASAEAKAEDGEKKRRRRTRGAKRDVTLPLEDMKEGMELEGVVKGVMNYGAFIGGLGTPTDGLVHVSQLAAGFVENVSDIVSVGDKVKVRVLSIDTEKGTFALTMKSAQEVAGKGAASQDGSASDRDASRGQIQEQRKIDLKKKWDVFSFDPEKFISVKVQSLMDFGAFCQILDEDMNPLESAPTDGLIHISELAVGRVEKVQDVVKEGDVIQARILGTDPERNRISMSLKPVPTAEELRAQQQNESNSGGSGGATNYTSRRRNREPLDPNESTNVSADMETAKASQPEFKTSFQLAFEKANFTPAE